MPQEVAELSKRNFPLCMKSMQEMLNTTHHIKYKARLQYGLFLKGIGMTLEDAMKFFRSEFTKKTDIDVDKFEKEYAYGIRSGVNLCDVFFYLFLVSGITMERRGKRRTGSPMTV